MRRSAARRMGLLGAAAVLSRAFAAEVMRDNRVDGAEATSPYASRVQPVQAESHDEQPPELPNTPAGRDPLFPLQWDMRQIDSTR